MLGGPFPAMESEPSQSPGPAAGSSEPEPMSVDPLSLEEPLTDSMIDPALLAISIPPFNTGEARPSSASGVMPTTPALVQSPMASTSSLFDPLTPREEPQPEPEVYRPEQGTSRLRSRRRPRVSQRLVDAIAEDPVAAATMLLDMATNNSSSSQQFQLHQVMPVQNVPMPTAYNSQQPTYPSYPPTTYTNPTLNSNPNTVMAQPGPPPVLATAAQLMTLLDSRRAAQKTTTKLNKQDVLRRARERRKLLAAELERAKVELWETTIEQGVLAHLVKEGGGL